MPTRSPEGSSTTSRNDHRHGRPHEGLSGLPGQVSSQTTDSIARPMGFHVHRALRSGFARGGPGTGWTQGVEASGMGVMECVHPASWVHTMMELIKQMQSGLRTLPLAEGTRRSPGFCQAA